MTTVTRKISDLESVLGAKLLVRTTRKLSLTDAGISYLAAARRIIDQVEEAEREVAGEFTAPKGELVVTAPIQFGQLHVLPVLIDFLALFPQINVRLLLLDRNVQLVEDHVDMAVRIGKLPDSTMIATAIGSMRMVVCASPEFLADRAIPQTPEELQRLPCVTFDGPTPSPGWQLRDPQTNAPMIVPVTSRLSVTTVEGAVRAAIRNVGVTRLLYYQVAERHQSRKASSHFGAIRTRSRAGQSRSCGARPDATKDAAIPGFCRSTPACGIPETPTGAEAKDAPRALITAVA